MTNLATSATKLIDKAMGIRFSCHMCNHPLHVKDYQAGKRGKCPKCQGSFRVPAKDSDFSLAVEESAAIPVTAKSRANNAPKPDTAKAALPKSATPIPSKATTAKPEASKVQAPSSDLKPTATAGASDPLAMPTSLLPLLDARWFVRPPSGGQYGPATTQMLLDWIAEKRVTADSLLWRDGLETWFPARELVPEPFGGQSNLSQNSPVDVPPPAVAKLGQEIRLNAAPPGVTPLTPSGPATNKAALAMKKKKQLKKQWMVLGFLATIALSLFIALLVILSRGA